ncbi:MAG: anti-sigma F factor, partial [Firmicutes bacterium]|nr:anti-sigma F factor [Bacillota bacterium]
MLYDNEMKIEFASRSENESFARVCVAAFAAELDPTMGEMTDIKTAVSEAVTNAVIHGYEGRAGTIYLRCGIKDDTI